MNTANLPFPNSFQGTIKDKIKKRNKEKKKKRNKEIKKKRREEIKNKLSKIS